MVQAVTAHLIEPLAAQAVAEAFTTADQVLRAGHVTAPAKRQKTSADVQSAATAAYRAARENTSDQVENRPVPVVVVPEVLPKRPAPPRLPAAERVARELRTISNPRVRAQRNRSGVDRAYLTR